MSLAVSQNCDFFTPCDPFFVLELDANSDGTSDCTRTSAEYTDTNVLSNPPDAILVCDVPDGAVSIKLSVRVFDADVLNPPEPIDYAAGVGSAVVYTLASPFSETRTEMGDASNGYAAQLSWTVEAVGT